VTERLLLARYLLAQYLREQAHWRLDTVDGNPMRAAHCVLALIDAATYIRELPGDDPCVAALVAAGLFAGGAFKPDDETRDFIRRWQFVDRPSGGSRDLLRALALRCARPHTAILTAPQPRLPVDSLSAPAVTSPGPHSAQQVPGSRPAAEGRRSALAAARGVARGVARSRRRKG
jgi:hypothetical protein